LLEEIKTLLRDDGHLLDYLTKIKGKLIKKINGNVALKSYLLSILSDLMVRIENQNIRNVSNWIKGAQEQKILYEFEI